MAMGLSHSGRAFIVVYGSLALALSLLYTNLYGYNYDSTQHPSRDGQPLEGGRPLRGRCPSRGGRPSKGGSPSRGRCPLRDWRLSRHGGPSRAAVIRGMGVPRGAAAARGAGVPQGAATPRKIVTMHICLCVYMGMLTYEHT